MPNSKYVDAELRLRDIEERLCVLEESVLAYFRAFRDRIEELERQVAEKAEHADY